MSSSHFGDEGHGMTDQFRQRVAAERAAMPDRARLAREGVPEPARRARASLSRGCGLRGMDRARTHKIATVRQNR